MPSPVADSCFFQKSDAPASESTSDNASILGKVGHLRRSPCRRRRKRSRRRVDRIPRAEKWPATGTCRRVAIWTHEPMRAHSPPEPIKTEAEAVKKALANPDRRHVAEVTGPPRLLSG